jgi:hypothetical protein
MNEIFIKILEIFPHWFTMGLIILICLHKFCDTNIRTLIRLVGKWKARDEMIDRQQNDRIAKVEQTIGSIETRLDTMDLGINRIESTNQDILDFLTKK